MSIICCLINEYKFIFINFYSLIDVLMEESKLYLVFEYLKMDLRRYMEKFEGNSRMSMSLIQVFFFFLLLIKFCVN